MRTRSRTAAKPPSPPASSPQAKSGYLTKKPPTKRQLVASAKKLGRKRLQLKKAMEKRKRELDERERSDKFDIKERIRMLTDMGPTGQLGSGSRLKAVPRAWKSEEAMRAKKGRRRVGKSPLAETW
jgi:hypothetical protein